jgi:uncharacterized protein with PIN domain
MSNNSKTGRPRGSAGTQVVVEAELPRCPRCNSTGLKVFKVLRDQTFSGVHDGQPYDRIVRKRMRCEACGAYPVVKFHRFSGKMPPEK